MPRSSPGRPAPGARPPRRLPGPRRSPHAARRRPVRSTSRTSSACTSTSTGTRPGRPSRTGSRPCVATRVTTARHLALAADGATTAGPSSRRGRAALLRAALARQTPRPNTNPGDGEATFRLGQVLARTRSPDEAYEACRARRGWNQAWRACRLLGDGAARRCAGQRPLRPSTTAREARRRTRTTWQAQAVRSPSCCGVPAATPTRTPWLARALDRGPARLCGSRDLAGHEVRRDWTPRRCLDVAARVRLARRVARHAARLLEAAAELDCPPSVRSTGSDRSCTCTPRRVLAQAAGEHGGAGPPPPPRARTPMPAVHCLASRLDDADSALQAARRPQPPRRRPGLARSSATGCTSGAATRRDRRVDARSTELDPSDPVVWRNRAVAAFNVLADPDAARQHYERALAVAPGDPRLALRAPTSWPSGPPRRPRQPPRPAARTAERSAVDARDDLTVELAQLQPTATGSGPGGRPGAPPCPLVPAVGGRRGPGALGMGRAHLALARRALRRRRALGRARARRRGPLDPSRASLREARHPLANRAQLHLLLGDALAATGRPAAAARPGPRLPARPATSRTPARSRTARRPPSPRRRGGGWAIPAGPTTCSIGCSGTPPSWLPRRSPWTTSPPRCRTCCCSTTTCPPVRYGRGVPGRAGDRRPRRHRGRGRPAPGGARPRSQPRGRARPAARPDQPGCGRLPPTRHRPRARAGGGETVTVTWVVRTMPGVFLPGDSTAQLRDLPVPRPARVRSCSVGASGSAAATSATSTGATRATEDGRPRLPRRDRRHEPSGTVVAAGHRLSRDSRVGDRVCLPHRRLRPVRQLPPRLLHQLLDGRGPPTAGSATAATRRYLLAEESTLHPPARRAPFVDGALIACGFGTAYEGLRRIGVSGDDDLLVVGPRPGRARRRDDRPRPWGPAASSASSSSEERRAWADPLGLFDATRAAEVTRRSRPSWSSPAAGAARSRSTASGSRRWAVAGRRGSRGVGTRVAVRRRRPARDRGVRHPAAQTASPIHASWVTSLPAMEDLARCWPSATATREQWSATGSAWTRQTRRTGRPREAPRQGRPAPRRLRWPSSDSAEGTSRSWSLQPRPDPVVPPRGGRSADLARSGRRRAVVAQPGVARRRPVTRRTAPGLARHGRDHGQLGQRRRQQDLARAPGLGRPRPVARSADPVLDAGPTRYRPATDLTERSSPSPVTTTCVAGCASPVSSSYLSPGAPSHTLPR